MKTGSSTNNRRLSTGLALAVGILLAPTAAWGADDAASTGPVEAPDYSQYSHQQLTELGARWNQLGDAERRALLQEVKHRMDRQKGPDGVLQIRTERRYGKVIHHADGRVVRIETQVVEVRPVRPGMPEQSFGVGFENRTRSHQSAVEADGTVDSVPGDGEAPGVRVQQDTPPVVRVNDPAN